MTTKQLSKLATRIAMLKAQGRIVWIEGIEADIIKGKIAGKACYFAKAETLNAAGGHWYYIVRWNARAAAYDCSCEAYKPCKHEGAVQGHCAAMLVTLRIAQIKPIDTGNEASARCYRDMFYDPRFS